MPGLVPVRTVLEIDLKATLLDEIEVGALDSEVPLSDLLRKCVALGGRSGSVDLRDWALSELNGYGQPEEVPTYRQVPAVIAMDSLRGGFHVTGEQISTFDLPHFARDSVEESVRFTNGIRELEQLSTIDDTIRISLPGSAVLVKFMRQERGLPVERLYWIVSKVAVRGVLDRVRTSLVGLVAEIRSTPDGVTKDGVPSRDAATQAVNVIINGGRRNSVSIVTASGGSIIETGSDTGGRGTWVRLRKPATFVVGVAGLTASIAAVAAWLGWSPM